VDPHIWLHESSKRDMRYVNVFCFLRGWIWILRPKEESTSGLRFQWNCHACPRSPEHINPRVWYDSCNFGTGSYRNDFHPYRTPFKISCSQRFDHFDRLEWLTSSTLREISECMHNFPWTKNSRNETDPPRVWRSKGKGVSQSSVFEENEPLEVVLLFQNK